MVAPAATSAASPTNWSLASRSAPSQAPGVAMHISTLLGIRVPLLGALPRSSAGAQGLEGPLPSAPHQQSPPLGTCTLGSGSARPQAQPHCPPWRGPMGSPSAHTLARATSRRPRRERRSRRNRRAASGTSTARSCRSRLWDRDRTSRSCGGTDGQVDRQMGGRQAERGHMDERTEREGWRRGGRGWRARGPLGWTSPAPLGCHCGGGHYLGLGSHLFQALHVLEVEADVEEAQVGVDKLELWEGSRRAVPLPPPNPGAPPMPHAEPSLPACWLPLTRTTLIMRCFS